MVQIVLKEYPNIESVLSGFDIDAACVAFDGKRVLCNNRGLRAWYTGINVVDIRRQSPTYTSRLLKYHHKYGFGISDPGYIPSRIVVSNSNNQGLASLISLIHRPIYVGYNSGTQVCSSKTVSDLIRNIQRFVDTTRNKQPFLLRYNNTRLYNFNENESVDLPPQLRSGNFIDGFPVHTDSWYAAAYGKKEITHDEEKKIDKVTIRNWIFDLGRYVLSPTGLRRK